MPGKKVRLSQPSAACSQSWSDFKRDFPRAFQLLLTRKVMS